MNNDNKQVYGLTEAQWFRLYQAEHLTKLLMAVSERKRDENPFLSMVESESFCVAMGIIRDLIDTDAIKGIESETSGNKKAD